LVLVHLRENLIWSMAGVNISAPNFAHLISPARNLILNFYSMLDRVRFPSCNFLLPPFRFDLDGAAVERLDYIGSRKIDGLLRHHRYYFVQSLLNYTCPLVLLCPSFVVA
jgi:hypothetical protein